MSLSHDSKLTPHFGDSIKEEIDNDDNDSKKCLSLCSLRIIDRIQMLSVFFDLSPIYANSFSVNLLR
jgi:hypothetical protein